jgi:fimbrial chaperone protein
MSLRSQSPFSLVPRSGRLLRARALVAYVALVLAPVLTPPPSEAGGYTIEPVHVFLSGARTSMLLSLRNTGEEPLRLQVTAFAWDQGADGSMQLAATTDIIFFPKLLVLAAGEQRRIRVAVAVPPGPIERTYRLILEELPPPESQRQAAAGGVGARIVTRTSVPIFLAPTKPVVSGRIASPRLARSVLSLDVLNTGNVHLLPRSIRISGTSASGSTIFEREISGWYILAAATRQYTIPIPHDVCRGLGTIHIEVRTADAVYAERLIAPATSCAG